jgi:hypothetical protein
MICEALKVPGVSRVPDNPSLAAQVNHTLTTLHLHACNIGAGGAVLIGEALKVASSSRGFI